MSDGAANIGSGENRRPILQAEAVADAASLDAFRVDGDSLGNEDDAHRYLFGRPSTEGPFVSQGEKRPYEQIGESDNDDLSYVPKRSCPGPSNADHDFNFRPPPYGGGDPFGNGGDGDDNKPVTISSSFKLTAIGGLDEQISYLKRSIILPLVKSNVFKNWGMSPPKGILLHGPPGTGKTYMAKAIVNELKNQLGHNVSFFYRKGGDVFSMWFGESQRKLREVFAAAKRHQPSVIFFDEIDGLCPSRERSYQGTEAYNSVVTCFLGQMDALENGNVFVIAATNRLNAVDPAVRRPGRFDKHLGFNFPDEEARQKIIRIHTSTWSRSDKPSDELVANIAARTMGFTGADLEKLCKDAILVAIQQGGENIKLTPDHWITALNSMQRTASDSFGSNILVPNHPSQIVFRLIKPDVDQVVSRIAPLLSPELARSKTFTTSKTLLIHITPNQSKEFLNTQILHGILCHTSFKKCPLFEIAVPTLLNKLLNLQKPSLFTAIVDVINQAKEAANDSGYPAVVVLPNLNDLLDIWKSNYLPPTMLFHALTQVKGPKMVLLATSTKPLEDFEEKNFQELFGSNLNYFLENPDFSRLSQFFDTLPQAAQNEDLKDVLQYVAESAARIAEHQNHDFILNLYNSLKELQEEKDREIGDDEDAVADVLAEEITEEFENILDQYKEARQR